MDADAELEMKVKCYDCGAAAGELHKPGCDVEQCPRCGGQLISCGCLKLGANAAWIEKNLLPWTGVWPGKEDAIELGLWCKWVRNERFEADVVQVGLDDALRRLGAQTPGRWAVCGKDDPEATPDLDRLRAVASWDLKKKRFVKRDHPMPLKVRSMEVKFDALCMDVTEDILKGLLLAIKERTMRNVAQDGRDLAMPDDVRRAFMDIKAQWAAPKADQAPGGENA